MTACATGPLSPGLRVRVRQAVTLLGALPEAGIARLLAPTSRSSRFTGAYPTRMAVEVGLARFGAPNYDDESTAEVSLDVMRRRALWDYPVLFWLSRLLPDYPSVLDAGGHLGTKFTAFSSLLDLARVRWTVYDLPGIVRAAHARQATGAIPAAIAFVDRLENALDADVLLVSGLLQYLPTPFSDFVDALPHRPRFILINKIAFSPKAERFCIERIGRARVAYRLRARAHWDAEVARMGYEVLDSWTIPDLGHVIPTHPWLGRSESMGFVLKRTDKAG